MLSFCQVYLANFSMKLNLLGTCLFKPIGLNLYVASVKKVHRWVSNLQLEIGLQSREKANLQL